MLKVKDIEKYLFDWAPLELAEDWDNVGLLVGDGEQEVHKILVSLTLPSRSLLKRWNSARISS